MDQTGANFMNYLLNKDLIEVENKSGIGILIHCNLELCMASEVNRKIMKFCGKSKELVISGVKLLRCYREELRIWSKIDIMLF